MKLEEMKRIADARTKGTWEYLESAGAVLSDLDEGNPYIGNIEAVPGTEIISKTYMQLENGQFIAMAANNFDKLLEVAEAIKYIHEHMATDRECDMRAVSRLDKALKELEKE